MHGPAATGRATGVSVISPPKLCASETRLASSFYDDFEDFGEIGPNSDGEKSDKKSDDDGGGSGDGESESTDDDDTMMKSLRDRMSSFREEEEEEGDDDDDDDDDSDSGSAISDMEGQSISSVEDLIGFAQSKARRDGSSNNKEDDWAVPIPHTDEDTGDTIDFDDILEGGIILMANPAKFCPGLEKKKEKKGLGGLFDPFPSQPQSNDISPTLLAKFGLQLPPPRDLGPDRRADLLPVLLLLDRHPQKGCKAVLMNRRTGYLLGDLEQQLGYGGDSGGDDGSVPAPSPKLGAFMIQPLWFGGTAPGGDSDGGEGSGNGGMDLLHWCPLVDDAKPLSASDGLFWGGDPAQAQEVMNDARLEKAMAGFDFKFFVQSTRWLPEQLEKEIQDGTWYIAKVSKEVIFKSRDRLGSKRAKPLWTEIMDLLGGKYREARDMLYDDVDYKDDDDDL